MITNAAISINRRIRRDPTRTTRIRAAFVRDVRRRWAVLKADIRKSVIDQDCFALDSSNRMINSPTGRKAFDFPRSEDKVSAFMQWLKAQEAAGILELVTRDAPRVSVNAAWSNIYIRTAYQQGISRARGELKKAGYQVPGSGAVQSASAMNAGFHADRVGLLYTRTFEDLKTVTDVTNARIRRQLSDVLRQEITSGAIEGRNPRAIAKRIVETVDSVGRVRAEMIARTEIVRAHQQATLVEYQQAAGDIEVEIEAEVSTAGFNVCPECEALAAGGPYTLAQAEGLLPRHPNCRCAWKPVINVAEIIKVDQAQQAARRAAA